MNRFFKFSGGIHPNDSKTAANSAIQNAPLFPSYLIPLQQHIGAPAKPIVAVGDTVLKGQKIAEAGSFVSSAIHAPTSGQIKSIIEALNVLGEKVPAILLVADGRDSADTSMSAMPDWEMQSPADLKKRIAEAGIVGMGGAAFPTQVKLSPPEDKPIDTLIINAAECEPGITGDYRLILEETEQFVTGIKILAKILQPKQIFIGIEKNKPKAIECLKKIIDTSITLTIFPTRYPQGAEKQMIYACTKREVPSGGLPMNIGCVVQNVATCVAVYEAVVLGKPLYERVMTVTGTPVVNPSNWRVRIGTSYEEVLRLAKGVKDEHVGKVISGGPMMGFSIYSLAIPVTKASGCLYLQTPQEVNQFVFSACICCGLCADACPMRLGPSKLSILIEQNRIEATPNFHLFDCIECGCCTYVCSAQRPIVQQIRQAKREVLEIRKKSRPSL